MSSWYLKMPLEPVAYGRTRIAKTKSGDIRPITPAKTRHAMNNLKLFMASADPILFEGAVSVELEFQFARPKSVSEKKRPFPSVKPDIDNICKSVFDAGSGILWLDDSQIVRLVATKTYGDRPWVALRVEQYQGAT